MTALSRNVELVGRFEKHTLPSGDVIYYDDAVHGYYSAIKPNPKSNGGYSFVQGSQLIGVSTPSKMLDSDADPLIYWGSRLDQEGIAKLAAPFLDADDFGEVPVGGLQWLRSQQTINDELRENGLTWAQNRQRRADTGEAVHEDTFLALASGNRPPSLSNLRDEDRGYGQAAFAWWRDRSPAALYAEQVTALVSLGLAGRFDLLATKLLTRPGMVFVDPEARVLVDAKTREKGRVRRSDHVQLPGYDLCNEACGIGRADLKLVLILKPDGTYEESWGVGTDDDFLSALSSFKRGKALQARIDNNEGVVPGEVVDLELPLEDVPPPEPASIELDAMLGKRSTLTPRRETVVRLMRSLGADDAAIVAELTEADSGRKLNALNDRLGAAVARRTGDA